MPHKVENIVRKEEIACYNKFLLFSQSFSQLDLERQNAALCGNGLTLPQTSPGFYVSAVQVLKTLWKKEKLLVTCISPFPTVFSTCLESFLPFSTFLQTLSVWKSKICRLGKGL